MQARAIATRTRMLDQTVEALVACGYSGTTTQEVCRRAGVSRGTLQYHFPTRIDLLVASLQHVLNGVVNEFVSAQLAKAPVSSEQLLANMWEQWKGPALTAWLELAVAARTNAELREPMRVVMLEFDDLVRQSFSALVGPDLIPPELAEAAPFFIFAIFNGLAVGRSYEAPGHETAVLAMLQRLAAGLLEESP